MAFFTGNLYLFEVCVPLVTLVGKICYWSAALTPVRVPCFGALLAAQRTPPILRHHFRE